MIQLIKKGEHGSVFDTDNGKLELKLDNSGNVQLSKSDLGLKANIELPELELPMINGAQEGVRIPLVEAVQEAYDKAQGIEALSAQVQGNTSRIEALEGVKAPTALTNVSISDHTLTFNRSNNESDITVELPAFPVDVKLKSLEFTSEGKLKATLSDDSTTEVEFTPEVVVKALESADSGQKERLKTLFLEILKGEEVQDLSGNAYGYLLATA